MASGIVKRGLSAAAKETGFGSKSELFKGASDAYAQYRPTYPVGLFDEIARFGGEGWKRGVAVDVAAGTGQASFAVAEHLSFDRVIAMDASATQVESGNRIVKDKEGAGKRVEFVEGTAEDFGDKVTAGTADLVTVGQALHWFDRPAFYRAAHKALRPETGVLAVFGYDLIVLDDEAGNAAVQHLHHEVLRHDWDAARDLVLAHLRGLEPPTEPKEDGKEPLWKDLTRIELSQRVSLSVPAFLGYLRTWSGYRTYMKRTGTEEGSASDPVVAVEAVLRDGGHEEVSGATAIFGFLARPIPL